MASPYTLKWGIMATGMIADMFSKDLLCDPTLRDASDVRHEIVAVASSSSKQRSQDFITALKLPSSSPQPKAYGSYAELVADPDVDIVYVASPHSHHFQNCMLALEAGKHILCEKALTVNAAQARKLVETARAKTLFFMEAVWTRFFPLSIKVRELITSGEIGTVYRTLADLSLNQNAVDDVNGSLTWPASHRMVNKDLAGGATLDLGVYSLTWIFQTLYHVQPEADKEAPKITAAYNTYPTTGVDENTAIILQFPQHKTLGVATTGFRTATDYGGLNGSAAPAARIQGSKGEIQVMHPLYSPTQIRVVRRKAGQEGLADVEVLDFPMPTDPKRDGCGRGMFFEADECARCLRDGKLESSGMPWEESVQVMQAMEEALRQGGVEYPDLIATDVYDPKSPLNVGNQ